MTKRELTVSQTYYQTCTRLNFVPFIRLSGKWLGSLGFNTGDKIEVITSNNQIIIKRK